MIKRITLCILAILFYSGLEAQTIYAVSSSSKIYRINDDYSASYLYASEYYTLDIAIAPSGEMYGVGHNIIYRLDLSSGLSTFVADLPSGLYTSLVCSNDYKLYMINFTQKILYKYDLLTNEITEIAYLGYQTPGDLTFYKGNLIFQAVEDHMIKAYNLETQSLSNIMCNTFSDLWGLTNIYGDCNNETILAVNPSNELLTIDFDSQTFITITLPSPFSENELVYGLTTTNEHLGSLCTAQNLVDLNCEMSIAATTLDEVVVYPNPASEHLYFTNYATIENIMIYDITGKLVKTIHQAVPNIDISDLANGIYTIKIEAGQSLMIKKFIKQ